MHATGFLIPYTILETVRVERGVLAGEGSSCYKSPPLRGPPRETVLGKQAQDTRQIQVTASSQMCKFRKSSYLTNATRYYRSELVNGVDPTHRRFC